MVNVYGVSISVFAGLWIPSIKLLFPSLKIPTALDVFLRLTKKEQIQRIHYNNRRCFISFKSNLHTRLERTFTYRSFVNLTEPYIHTY